MSILEQLITWSQEIIHVLGYPGIAVLIALETVVPPIPSEVVLPLAGSLSATGKLNLVLAIVAATAGSLAGSSFLYLISRWAGQSRLERWVGRYGKWIMLSRSDLNKSIQWFDRYGSHAVLVCRLVPGIRSIVSIPAGLALMPLGRFLALTTVGSALWNSALVTAGYLLGQNWSQIEAIVSPLSKVVYAGVALSMALFVVTRFARRLQPERVRIDDRSEE